MPGGAAITTVGPKSARFDWTPSSDQVMASERWTIQIEADDGSHPPVPLDYVVVLQQGAKEGCPGMPPTITITSPGDGDQVMGTSYPVVVNVSDDMGIRDAPLLYWTTTAPDDPSAPDVTMFNQVTFATDPSGYRALVPSLGLAPGATAQVYFVVSATDDDDPTGTLCDHHTETPLHQFTAVSGGGGDAAVCDPCTASTECASGLCATAAGGGRCLDRCDGGMTCATGTCGDRVSVEGSVAQGCGDVAAVCDGGSTPGGCTDDTYEDNDTIAQAAAGTDMLSGQICADDPDYYRYDVSSGTLVDVTLSGFHTSDGDLDLHLLDPSGTILASSAGVSDIERASYCMATSGSLYAEVLGYMGAENHYDLSVTETAGGCCMDDPGEPDNAPSAARAISGSSFDGTICPGDDDYLSFSVTGPSHAVVTLVLGASAGIGTWSLSGPGGGLVGASRTTSATETITADLTDPGTYVIHVLGYSGAEGSYTGSVMLTSISGCSADTGCPSGQVCNAGSCVDASCTSSSTCPTGDVCPAAGPGMPTSQCGAPCAYNSDCRTTEACKRFPEGHYCGRRGAARTATRARPSPTAAVSVRA